MRRIFQEYAAGKPPERIARDLNGEGIKGPFGREWSNTTIRGQTRRGNGILNNETYVGKISWNRCSYVKDPSTGKRVARPNPKGKWEVVAVPELRIVDDELWDDVKRRQFNIRNSLRGQVRPTGRNGVTKSQCHTSPALSLVRSRPVRSLRRQLCHECQGIPCLLKPAAKGHLFLQYHCQTAAT